MPKHNISDGTQKANGEHTKSAPLSPARAIHKKVSPNSPVKKASYAAVAARAIEEFGGPQPTKPVVSSTASTSSRSDTGKPFASMYQMAQHLTASPSDSAIENHDAGLIGKDDRMETKLAKEQEHFKGKNNVTKSQGAY